jgi:L-amino acid N-acyltransferase YncA
MLPTIRPATHGDEHALRRIDHATWSTDTTPAPRPTLHARFFADGRRSEDVLVATIADDLAGYVLLGEGYSLPTHAHVAFIRGLAVDPALQGRGLGRLLLQEALASCGRRGLRRVRSSVLATNPASLAVHRSCGFVVEGILVGEFVMEGIPVDDVLLAYTFDTPSHPGAPGSTQAGQRDQR